MVLVVLLKPAAPCYVLRPRISDYPMRRTACISIMAVSSSGSRARSEIADLAPEQNLAFVSRRCLIFACAARACCCERALAATIRCTAASAARGADQSAKSSVAGALCRISICPAAGGIIAQCGHVNSVSYHQYRAFACKRAETSVLSAVRLMGECVGVLASTACANGGLSKSTHHSSRNHAAQRAAAAPPTIETAVSAQERVDFEPALQRSTTAPL
jgi:hypothetical protein